MSNTLLRNGSLLVGDELSLLRGDLLMVDGKIAAIGKITEIPKNTTIVDADDWLVMPGFVNTHTHVAMTLLRGYGADRNLSSWLQDYIWPAEAKLSDEDVYWGSALGIAEMLAAGVTTFADMYDHMDAVATAVEESGIRAQLCRGMIGMYDKQGRSIDENDQLYSRWHGAANGRIQVWYGPHAPNTCDIDYIQEVVKHARERQTGIHIHVSETQEEVAFVEKTYGVSPVEMLARANIFDVPNLYAHAVWLNKEEIKYLGRHDVAIAHNPASNMKLASGMAPVIAMRDAGITVGIGTDGASSNNRLSVLRDMQLAALMHKMRDYMPTAIKAEEAVSMATIEGARALRRQDEIGSLVVGKEADVICLKMDQPWLTPNFDPIATLVYAAESRDVVRTYVAGKLCYDDGQWPSLDIEKIRDKAINIAKRITS